MKDGQFNNDPVDPRLDDQDPVWRLLAESKRPEPDAWFATRTMARCKFTGPGADLQNISLSSIWRWALGGGLSICMAVFLLVPHPQPKSTVPDKQKNVQEAFAIMASMDTSDTDSNTNSSWQDTSL